MMSAARASPSSGRRPGVRTTIGLDRLAPAVVGHADDGGIGHRRVGEQGVLHLGRVDVLAAGHDHVLDPVVQEQVAVLAQPPGVAGAEPPVLVETRPPSRRACSSSRACSGATGTGPRPRRRGAASSPVAESTMRSSTWEKGRPADRSRSARGPSGSWSLGQERGDGPGGLGESVDLGEVAARGRAIDLTSTSSLMGEAP